MVDEDGSPHGPRDFVLWNPPLVEGTDARRSANSEATLLFAELVKAGIRNITFTKARRTAELVFKHARDILNRDAPELAPLIAAYRAGYRPEDRRQIEQALFRGDLVGVAATTALELGVDIGKLDATVLTGYPGTLASLWQQAGRSGRGRDRALTFLVGMDNPLDQYLMRHPGRDLRAARGERPDRPGQSLHSAAAHARRRLRDAADPRRRGPLRRARQPLGSTWRRWRARG